MEASRGPARRIYAGIHSAEEEISTIAGAHFETLHPIGDARERANVGDGNRTRSDVSNVMAVLSVVKCPENAQAQYDSSFV